MFSSILSHFSRSGPSPSSDSPKASNSSFLFLRGRSSSKVHPIAVEKIEAAAAAADQSMTEVSKEILKAKADGTKILESSKIAEERIFDSLDHELGFRS